MLEILTVIVAICLHPPYPVLVVVFILAGFGNGLGDSGWYGEINFFDRVQG
jgi:hypothetical protein